MANYDEARLWTMKKTIDKLFTALRQELATCLDFFFCYYWLLILTDFNGGCGQLSIT